MVKTLIDVIEGLRKDEYIGHIYKNRTPYLIIGYGYETQMNVLCVPLVEWQKDPATALESSNCVEVMGSKRILDMQIMLQGDWYYDTIINGQPDTWDEYCARTRAAMEWNSKENRKWTKTELRARLHGQLASLGLYIRPNRYEQ
jgi:hypothetical protein